MEKATQEIEYIFQLGELFEKVQTSRIFTDSKTFVDAVPRAALVDIKREYEHLKSDAEFNLEDFVRKWFEIPKRISSDFVSDLKATVPEHIEKLWDVLTRHVSGTNSSLIALPHPYVVPGGRFREMFYWDSYFTMLGLQLSGRVDLIASMVKNFAYLLDKYGYIPNGNRTYFLHRSQPPYFVMMVALLAGEQGDDIWKEYLAPVEKEYAFWMAGSDKLNTQRTSVERTHSMPDGSVLNHYWSHKGIPRPESYLEDLKLAEDLDDKESFYRHERAACESGWDFSSRWFRDQKQFSSIHTAHITPIDLNCLLWNLENTLSLIYKNNNQPEKSYQLANAADKRKSAIEKYLWDKERKFYFDFDYTVQKRTDSYTLAALYPLFFKLSTQEQSNHLARTIKEKFLKKGGLITTTVVTGQQWDAPNGWAPLQWMTVKGLMNYGHTGLAEECARRWMQSNERIYRQTGKMMEKYDVEEPGLKAGGGGYPNQDGFGWTNGVYLTLRHLFPDADTAPEA